jgi:hypothetical protein
MAYLLHVHVTDASDVGLIPTSLADSAWATGFQAKLDETASMGAEGCTVHFLEDDTELAAFFTTTAPTGSDATAVAAWKTENNITVTYALYDAPASSTSIPSGKY